MPISPFAKSRIRQQGLTLMELMVALGLSAFLMLAVAQTFLANQQSNRTQLTYARVQESGRMAMEFLQRDIRMADYWGCSTGFPDRVEVDHLDHSDPDWTPAKSEKFKAGKGLTGRDDVPANTTIAGKTVIQGTDTITTISGTGAGSDLEIQPPYYNENQASIPAAPGHTLKRGDIILMTNCSGRADIVSIVTTNTNAGTITHSQGNITVAGAVDNDPVLYRIDYTYQGDLQVLVPRSTTYFLSTGANGNPSLFVSTDEAAGVELVPNVQNMQILYGEDRDGDNFVERYSEADVVDTNPNDSDVEHFSDVKTVRIQLLVAGAEDVNFTGTTTFNGAAVAADGRLRRVYSTTVAVRNRVLPNN